MRGHAEPGEIIYDLGDEAMACLSLSAAASKLSVFRMARRIVIKVLEPGTFTGEVNQLSGRRSLVRCRAHEATDLLEFGRAMSAAVMQTDAALGEILLRAFVLRRVYLIENSVGDAVLIGSSHSSDTLRLKNFLARNGHPHTYVDVETDPDIQKVLDHFQIAASDIPVLICRGELVLRNPSNAEAAECFGLNAGIDERRFMTSSWSARDRAGWRRRCMGLRKG